MDTLHEDQYTFFIISRPVFLRMRNVPDNIVRENQNKLYAQYGISKIVPFFRYCGKIR